MIFLVIFLVIFALTFRRVRTILLCMAGFVSFALLPGVFPDPSIAWLLIIAVVVFGFGAYAIVRGVAAMDRLDRQQGVIEPEQAKPINRFGKFRPRA